ncbi:PEP-CTERM sorting domain-containing protein [Coleofasciculus sp. F4-SAH-05]|uniref:PEP-CTERM sorting domain-containing protein n=1 Tax=Coleofasciculus sp. F4-SAH-05 TaxID=3069525 RepID=UPI0033044DD1
MSFVGKTASVFGVVGLSAIATLGVVESAEAAGVRLGSDYFQTTDGTFFDFGGTIGKIDFEGNPIGTFQGNNVGLADTIVERKDDVALDVGDSGMTAIEVVALSLKSVNSVNGYDIFVNLTEGKPSTGTMTINHENPDTDPSQGTFSSSFYVFFTAMFKPVGGGDAIPCPVEIVETCDFEKHFTASGEWTHTFKGLTKVESPPATDQAANVHLNPQAGFDDFFVIGQVTHDAGTGTHVVHPPAPEPLTILGSATALGFGALFKKQSSRKRNKKDMS